MRVSDLKKPQRAPWIFLRLAVYAGGTMLLLNVWSTGKLLPKVTNPGDWPTVSEELQRVVLGHAEPPLVFKRAGFSMVAPAGWTRVTDGNVGPYDVVFRSPNAASLSIVVSSVDFNDVRSLADLIERKERAAGIHTQMDVIDLGGRKTIRRTAELTRESLLSFDFVENSRAFHILCATGKAEASKYVPVMADLVATIRPLEVATAGEPGSPSADGSEPTP